jgi:O-succinylbenzoate synthase
VEERRVLLLTIDAEGLEGWGECVAASVPSETTETAWDVLTRIALPRVVGRELARPTDVLDPVGWVRGHPMALAALEMAAWDLCARAAGVSLAKLLGGERRRVAVGVALGLSESFDRTAAAVERALADGYARVKLKIAPGRDVEVLAGLRERFPSLPLSADANCAYTLADAPRLEELDALDLEMLEQPLAWDDLVDHARLQEKLETPICLDESIGSERAAAAALALGSCRIVNLKPGRVGGLAASLRIHDLLVSKGMPFWCGGMLETGIGRAHNLALASLPGFTLPGDISASRRYWERDIVTPEHVVSDGTMSVPDGVGIGVDVDRERIDALSARVEAFG